MIGMQNLPGDKNNPMCYSNIITLPGPKGWVSKGYIPSEVTKEVIAIINSYKNKFICECEKSGRKIISKGHFESHRNQYNDDEERILNTKPRVPEDILVHL